MRTIALFILSAIFEVGGGYLVWQWQRESKAFIIGLGGFVALAIYGVLQAHQPAELAFGRVYAAYGGVFITTALLWGWIIDGHRPDIFDILGVALCLLGVMVMVIPHLARSN